MKVAMTYAVSDDFRRALRAGAGLVTWWQE